MKMLERESNMLSRSKKIKKKIVVLALKRLETVLTCLIESHELESQSNE